ncbi:hypothetical protein G3578_01090 [Brevibacillus sp. SYP-B805]|uniref:hypothetical protein n=1 Tax=Brevibacillus sp. SYP-B805 TaxID=1578199 RepID=UPI0013EB5025|nr:hypothetical protein [Brevibacillus sp. SYP-B805]NGQ93764.1 hypothetical protein [Brevibacillus sp. SYP-B805]
MANRKRFLNAMASLLFTSALLLSTGAGASETGQPAKPPQRVSTVTLPANIAFTSNHHLWLLDASLPQAAPKAVTRSGSAGIIGWSFDGAWLLYTFQANPQAAGSPSTLWAVKADGSLAQQVDPRPVTGRPQWSPTARKLVYFTQGADGRLQLLLAEIGADNKVKTRLLPTDAEVADIAWMPDGQGLLGSVPAGKNRPMQLVKLDLTGKRTETYRLGNPPNVEEGIYPYLADGLKVSPNGRYVAYFERLNSASLSADGVPIKLFDLQASVQPKTIGSGLAYPEWLAWSPDSRLLAYIVGGGREATANKQLAIIDATTGNPVVAPPAQSDRVETLPAWAGGPNGTLFFTRGKGSVAWEGKYDPRKPLVPGQRIWMRSAAGAMQPVTQGDDRTADTYPNPSPDSRTLLYLRLDGAEHGSLRVKTAGTSADRELLTNVTGDPGYYGNYLPAWVQVYWKKKTNG